MGEILKIDGHIPERITIIDANGIRHSIKRLKDGEGRVLWTSDEPSAQSEEVEPTNID